jgi:hypothetical protein
MIPFAPRFGLCLGSVCVLMGMAAGQAVFAGDAPPAPDRVQEIVRQALALEHGEGVPKDPLKAAELYCAAALQGSAEGMYSLGWMYANGRGLAHNDRYAGTLFAMAGFLGHEHAQRMLQFTGDYTGEVPECLVSREPEVPVWDFAAYLESEPPARQRLLRVLVETAKQFDIDPRLAVAVAKAESNLNPEAVSPKNAMGVMQLIPDTAARFNVRNVFDPVQNIRGGLAYLRWLLAYFQGDIALAVAGYNAGEGAVDRFKGVPPYPETRAYVERILAFVARARHPYDSSVVAPSPVLAGLRVATQ